MNLALSEIFVISTQGSDFFEDFSQVGGDYYDVLGSHAFGNYRNLLGAITRHTGMGFFLSHINNPKSDPANNTFPDENYAREIMQLFSIGLYELNNDGSQKLDANAWPIPTYNNTDIGEYAKIFTGFSNGTPGGYFGDVEPSNIDAFLTTPMKMFDAYHEPGVKNLLNGLVVPAGQTGEQDVDMALDGLHNHPNTGPYICRALIQFFVSSNPSPAYIDRVASVFNDNGQGTRGDFKAVIKAILLDSEARDCNAVNHPTNGKLKEPLLRYSQFLKGFNGNPINGSVFTTMEDYYNATGQSALYSPSVFNFFSPFYSPLGDIGNAGLVAPEFQVLNSSTSIGYVNHTNWILFTDEYLSSEEGDSTVDVNLSTEWNLADTNPTALVDRLNIVLASGQLSTNTKNTIINAISQLSDTDDRLDLAMYLVMISPDCAIQK